jgi:hypothetical protein
MRFNYAGLILTAICGPAFAQQHVVRNVVYIMNPCSAGSQTAACDVVVYSTAEVDAQLQAVKVAATSECKQNIDAVQSKIATDMNALPSAVLSALRSEIKEELKAEILTELVDEIKSGHVKLKPTPTAEKTAK